MRSLAAMMQRIVDPVHRVKVRRPSCIGLLLEREILFGCDFTLRLGCVNFRNALLIPLLRTGNGWLIGRRRTRGQEKGAYGQDCHSVKGAEPHERDCSMTRIRCLGCQVPM